MEQKLCPSSSPSPNPFHSIQMDATASLQYNES